MTSFEVFIVISFVMLILAVVFNLNVEIDDTSSIRLQNMSVDELKTMLNTKSVDDDLRIQAFDRMKTLIHPSELCPKTYEMLYNPKFKGTKLIERFTRFVVENPTQSLSERVTNDFINQKMPEKYWVSIRQNWSKILLPLAFANSQLLFKGMQENEEQRLNFVVDVLSLDNNSYLIEVVEKYLNQSEDMRISTMNMKIAEGLYALNLNQADDVLRIVLKIMTNNENSDDFNAFSGKIESLVKKFAHAKDVQERFLKSLEAVDSSRWNTLRDELIDWLKTADK